MPRHHSIAASLPVVLLAACLGAATAARAGGTDAVAPGPAVVTVETRDRALIGRLAQTHGHLAVDPDQGTVTFEADALTRAALAAAKIPYRVDEAATAALRATPQALPGQAKGIPGFPCYRTVAETRARYLELAAQYPELVQIVDIGDSWERVANVAGGGRDLEVLRLTHAAVAGDKPKLFVMTAVHAREYTTAELGLRFAEWLLAGHGRDADATWLLDHQEVHLLVQSNPDGRVQAEAGLSWRKNTNRGYCGATSNNRGADLNRNFGFKWAQAVGGTGSSPNPCDLTYRGPSPASEPETQAIAAHLRALYPDRRGPLDTDPAPPDTPGLFLDLHSYSRLVLWPWGWTATGAAGRAPNATAYEALGRRLAWFNGYRPIQSNDLYPTDGTTIDEAYGELGVAALTFELGTAFFQDCASFESTIFPDNLRALIYAARVTRAPYRWPAGPEVVPVVASPPQAFAGDTIRIEASADDTRFSNLGNGTETAQAVASAQLTIGMPPWEPGALPLPMAAIDGAFDAPREAVQATISASALGPGPQLVYVQARDAAGHSGPPAAVAVRIVEADTHGSLVGRVTRAADGAPLAAEVAVDGLLGRAAADTGAYVHRLAPGSYAPLVRLAGYESAAPAPVQIAAGGTTTLDVVLYALCARTTQDAESGAAGWTADPPWGLVGPGPTPGPLLASRAWTDSPAGNYAANANASLTSPPLDLTGYTQPVLRFASWCDTQEGSDFGRVEYRTSPAGAWIEAWRCSGEPAWRAVELPLPALAGAGAAQVRFRFTSNASIHDDGWYLDDVVLEAGGPACRASQSDRLHADGFEPATP